MMKFLQYFKVCFMLGIISAMVSLTGQAYAQTPVAGRVVSGTVTDEKGIPMPGVIVLLKGTQTRTPTDTKGAYKINVSGNNAVLVFTYISYAKKEVGVGGKTTLDVQMATDAQSQNLSEVVVVGYGTQKKETLTGAVASVKGADMVKSPQPNLSNSFAGRIPGVIATNGSGEPGYDGSNILIRGQATTGNNSPLIVIDGVADRLGGLERLNSNDIESVTVLKDASAAIFGARAANGVILVVTKKGKAGKPELSYSYNQGFVQAANLPKMADAPTFATILNEIEYYRNPANGLNQRYSPADIAKFGDGSDPINYPNTDWQKQVLKSVALQHKQDVSIRGGSDKVDYYISVGNIGQDGLYKNGATKFTQYNVTSSIGVKVDEKLKFNLQLGYRRETSVTPAGISASTIFGTTYNQYPILPAYYPNGLPSPGNGSGLNPVVMVDGDKTGTLKGVNSIFNGTLNGSYQLPLKGLSLDGFLAVDQAVNNSKKFSKPWVTYQYNKNKDTYDIVKGGPTATSLDQNTSTVDLLTANIKLNYARHIGNHNLSAFVAYEQSETNNQNFYATRQNFLSTDLPELSQGGSLPTDFGNGGGSSVSSRQNFFGRINYDYKEKYLAEFQMREDGSSNFPDRRRFGFFPGISLGWRLSEEAWLKSSTVVNNLKLRASYGRLGNDRVSAYQFLENFGYSNGVFASGDNPLNTTGINYNGLANPYITWELSDKYNIGLDGTILKNITFSLNVFKENRTKILAKRNSSIPGVSGIGASQIPDENIGKVNNQGFDAEINYSKRVNEDFGFNIGGNITYAKSKIIFVDEAPNTLSYQRYTGTPLNSNLLYQASGIFRTQAEIDAYPHLPGTVPGDLKYVDYNGDGVINSLDQVRSDNSNIPQIVYGIVAGATYKNFDISILFSGTGKVAQYILPDAGTIGNFPSAWADNRWSPTNPNGDYPRAVDRSGTFYGNYKSTFWLRNTAFLRLKNVQVGYNLPANVLSKLKLSGVRIYASGFNLLTFTSLKDYDPEGNNETGYFYPQQKIYNLGVNVTF